MALRWYNGTLQDNATGQWVDVPVVVDTQEQPQMCPSCGSWVQHLATHECWVKIANG